MAGHVFIKSD